MLYSDYPEAQITNETKGQFLEAKERKKDDNFEKYTEDY